MYSFTGLFIYCCSQLWYLDWKLLRTVPTLRCTAPSDTPHLRDASSVQCNQGFEARDQNFEIVRCCTQPLCNNVTSLLTLADLIELFTLRRQPQSTTSAPSGPTTLLLLAFLLFALLAILALLACIYFRLRHYRKRAKLWLLRQHPEPVFSAHYTAHAKQSDSLLQQQGAMLELQPSIDTSAARTQSTELNDGAVSFHDGGCSSGRGAGSLITRTLANDVILEQPVGKGRSGEVWCARWKHYHVAVKSFAQVDYALWDREVRLYQLGLNHRNLLAFRGHDVISALFPTPFLSRSALLCSYAILLLITIQSECSVLASDSASDPVFSLFSIVSQATSCRRRRSGGL